MPRLAHALPRRSDVTSARLLAWLLQRVLFGEALPSPLHTVEKSPAVPHLLVHCHHEAFGLPLFEPALSHLLCTPQFAPALRAAGVPVRWQSREGRHALAAPRQTNALPTRYESRACQATTGRSLRASRSQTPSGGRCWRRGGRVNETGRRGHADVSDGAR